ncbi:hypothetical protein Hanom_Chr04g00305791 [Helianthus anomalus]
MEPPNLYRLRLVARGIREVYSSDQRRVVNGFVGGSGADLRQEEYERLGCFEYGNTRWRWRVVTILQVEVKDNNF